MDDERNQPPEKPSTQDDGNMPDTERQPYDYEPNRRFTPRRPDEPQLKPAACFGWVALGIVLGVFALLVAYLVYKRRDPALFWASLRYVLIGVGIGLLIDMLVLQMLSGNVNQGLEPGSPGWTSNNF